VSRRRLSRRRLRRTHLTGPRLTRLSRRRLRRRWLRPRRLSRRRLRPRRLRRMRLTGLRRMRLRRTGPTELTGLALERLMTEGLARWRRRGFSHRLIRRGFSRRFSLAAWPRGPLSRPLRLSSRRSRRLSRPRLLSRLGLGRPDRPDRPAGQHGAVRRSGVASRSRPWSPCRARSNPGPHNLRPGSRRQDGRSSRSRSRARRKQSPGRAAGRSSLRSTCRSQAGPNPRTAGRRRAADLGAADLARALATPAARRDAVIGSGAG
jgi:hypothetical protein